MFSLFLVLLVDSKHIGNYGNNKFMFKSGTIVVDGCMRVNLVEVKM